MKTLCTILSIVLLFLTAPCQAQQPTSDSAPFLFIYVVKNGDNGLPRIALGLEKPAVKITALEKCVLISTVNSALGGVAVQLKPDDSKALIGAIKVLAAPDATTLPNVVLWFTTPDNKALSCVDTSASNAELNLLHGGVLHFEAETQQPIIRYLAEKVHIQ